MKKLLSGFIALAILGAVIVAAVAGAQSDTAKKHERVKVPAPTTAPTTSTSTSTSSSSTTTTTKPKPVDPLAGVAMLGYRGRQIFALDGQGNEMRRLVLVFERRQVAGVQMIGDHHTIWYATTASHPQPGDNHCSDVVRLDLASNQRTVIARADGFSVSANGSRVALDGFRTEDQCKDGIRGIGASVVRDVATGAQSTVTGGDGALVISPGGHVVVSTKCTDDSDGCRIRLMRADLPGQFGAPITVRPINNPKLSFWGLTQRPEGLYALVDTQPQVCGCSGAPQDRHDRDVTIRRFAWTELGGNGTTVYTVQGPLQLWTVVPSANGLFATGIPGVSIGDPALFRLDGGSLEGLRPIDEYPSGFGAMPPFAG